MKTVPIDIAIEQAKRFTDLLAHRESFSLEKEKPQPFHYHAEYFSKADIEAVLSQNGCEGIRVYHALDDDGKAILLIVGATRDSDLLPVDSGRMESTDNIILCADENLRCPPMCTDNGLLSNL